MPKPKKPKPGAANDLLSLVWRNANSATAHSYGRLNHAMRKTLALAIGAGFKFTAADFKNLDAFRAGYWLGADEEWCYSLAVAEGNYSAAVAWEEHKGREPIIWNNVTPAVRHDNDGGFAHTSGVRESERLHVGCYFSWKGYDRVKVTSFNADGAAVAVAYKKGDGLYDNERKVLKRFTITRADVRAERAERKQREAVIKEFGDGKDSEVDFAKEFGVKTMKGLRAMPFKAFMRAAARIRKKLTKPA